MEGFFHAITRTFSTDDGVTDGVRDGNPVTNDNEGWSTEKGSKAGSNGVLPGTPTRTNFNNANTKERADSAAQYMATLQATNNSDSKGPSTVASSGSSRGDAGNTLLANERGTGVDNVVLGEDNDSDAEDDKEKDNGSKEEEFVVVDKYGFIIEDIDGRTGTSGGSRTTRAPISLKEKKRRADLESSRSIKWVKMIEEWERFGKRDKLKSRIRKGVPDKVRGKVWNLLSGVETLIKSNPGRYDRIISLSSTYTPNQDIRDTIERDINRTFPRHRMFKDKGEGQDSLRRVLRAYSLYDEEVGYCQGLGFITAMFLTYMPEEEAFWQVVSVMTKEPCYMRNMYEQGMPGAQKALYVGEKLIKKFFPKLTRHFADQNCHISMYATQWFMCIFTNSFPFDLVTGVWDCFLAEGWKIVYRIILTFLRYSAPKLFKLGFEGIMFFFKRLPERIDGPKIIQQAFDFPLKQRHVAYYERKFYRLNPDIKEKMETQEGKVWEEKKEKGTSNGDAPLETTLVMRETSEEKRMSVNL